MWISVFTCPCLSPQVLCFAVFFALVIKKVDEEDFQSVEFLGNDRNLGKRYILPKYTFLVSNVYIYLSSEGFRLYNEHTTFTHR